MFYKLADLSIGVSLCPHTYDPQLVSVCVFIEACCGSYHSLQSRIGLELYVCVKRGLCFLLTMLM